jgi:hypothetical protein
LAKGTYFNKAVGIWQNKSPAKRKKEKNLRGLK